MMFDLSTDRGRALYFGHNVRNGGFAQLLFNLGGEHLEEFADMLDRADAKVAASYYERALLACLDDERAYQAFLSSDFISENPLKDVLQSLSLDYFRQKTEFEQEAAAWLTGIGAASGLRIGVAGAHSGSSTTYVHLGDAREAWRIPATEYLEATFPAKGSPRAPAAAVQASVRRQGRDAGLLGARFAPERGSSEVVVRVAVGQAKASGPEPVGLSPADAQAVLRGLLSQTAGVAFEELGPGRLDVLWATSHAVDGSSRAFQRLAVDLVPLLALPVQSDEEAVFMAWRRQRESLGP